MSKLYLIPTPIGNLEDITLRALRILKEVDLILAEDTRTSSFLLKKYEIRTRMESHHMYNEHKSVERIAERILSGERIALISDAGTPGISDPGFLLVRECKERGIDIETLPGATAFVPALVNSGLPCDRFCFEGFLPLKKGRQTRIKELSDESRTIILYESPYRLVKTLSQLAVTFGEEREASVSRELTKLFEENRRATLGELVKWYSSNEPKGEIVIVVAGKHK
ncbi:MAG: 16S rRNA (cytidine(1402)-2'-O)-methyltransferase [Bacteroidales bacterium]|jgi:16S rRNA (cytidine1402-2'-O)-methyltransferase